MNKRIIVGVALAIAGVSSGLWAMKRAGATTSEVTRGPVRETLVTSGVVVAKGGIADVRARAEGRVMRVLVREGEQVLAGQLLAEIDNAEMRAVLARLEAEQRASQSSATAVKRGARLQERAAADADLRAAQHTLALAQDRANRIAKLHESGTESEQAAFASQAEVEMPKAPVEEAT